jgi:hypothetical protein
MKQTVLPRKTRRSSEADEKSSGKTPGKPRQVAQLSRKISQIPADRGAREVESKTQGSE